MKRNVVFLLACMFAMAGALPVSAGSTKTLKDVLGRYFLVGAAMNVDQIWNRTPDETNVVKNNFNSIVSFAEQGYAFEEIIGKQDDVDSKISLRWRIWDGGVGFVRSLRLKIIKFF